MSFLVLVDGEFGRAVANRIPGASVMLLADAVAGLDDALPAEGGFVAVALANKRVPQLEALDDACRARGVDWAVSFLADKYLYCGPFIRAGDKPCFRCFYRRDLTHLGAPRDSTRELAIDRHFGRDPVDSIAGFTPGAASMSAAFLARCARGTVPPGALRRLQVLTGSIDDTLVFGIHDCPHCSGKSPQQKLDQSHEHLVTALRGVLS